jgi:hypothetical protein
MPRGVPAQPRGRRRAQPPKAAGDAEAEPLRVGTKRSRTFKAAADEALSAARRVEVFLVGVRQAETEARAAAEAHQEQRRLASQADRDGPFTPVSPPPGLPTVRAAIVSLKSPQLADPRFERAGIIGGGEVAFDASGAMQGGMKRVFFTPERAHVVAFYHRENDVEARRRRLEDVLRYDPTAPGQTHADYWRDVFCWPSALVEHPRLGLGLVLPAYPPKFRFEKGDRKGEEKDGGWFLCVDRKTGRSMRYSHIHPAERGDLRGYLAALEQLARAVERLHNAGLAHADLSERNVLIDPVSGSAAVIDLDALVVTGHHPPEVLGTKGYIGPEVLATHKLPFNDPRRRHPSAESDKHALAVLIYRFLLERHPLEGRRVVTGASAEEEDDLRFGVEAVYSEHPRDPSNRPTGLDYLKASILGPRLEGLFQRAFIDGLREPAKRPTAGEWASALAGARDMLLGCQNPACTHGSFILTDRVNPRCPYCHLHRTLPFGWLQFRTVDASGRVFHSDEALVLDAAGPRGSLIMPHHTRLGAPRGPGEDGVHVALGTCTVGGLLAFRNIAIPKVILRLDPDGQPVDRDVAPRQSAMAPAGAELCFGLEPQARRAIVHIRDPSRPIR